VTRRLGGLYAPCGGEGANLELERRGRRERPLLAIDAFPGGWLAQHTHADGKRLKSQVIEAINELIDELDGIRSQVRFEPGRSVALNPTARERG
jgi:hypothetical protein